MAQSGMNAVELFAGAGGLGLGVSLAGFRPLLVAETDRNCRATIEHNRRAAGQLLRQWPEKIDCDVREIDYSALAGKVDIVSGGPPCQPFSMGGKHRAQADRRDMFPEAVRAIRETRPKAFVFENVKGLTRASFRPYYEYITLQMRHPDIAPLGDEDWSDHYSRLQKHHTASYGRMPEYRVVSSILCAADYGVPQKRYRVFFVGIRSDLGLEWSFPEPTHSLEALRYDQSDQGEYRDRHRLAKSQLTASPQHLRSIERACRDKPTTKPWVTVRDAIQDLPDPESVAQCRFSDHRFQQGARVYPGHTGSPIDEPAKTLKAGVHGVPGGENMLRRLDGSVRYFTVRESARLQTFPDDFELTGVWSEAMRQLGNAVPVRLAEILMSSIFRELGSITK